MERVSQEEMLVQFRERLQKILAENQQLSAKIKENEVTALKLQGAVEALEYYQIPDEEPISHPPEEDTEVGLTE